MEKNGKNGTFFYKERKRTQITERTFEKNGKERKERNVLLKRTDAQPCFTVHVHNYTVRLHLIYPVLCEDSDNF